MNSKAKQTYLIEVQYQNKMINNLQRWLRNSIVLSSLTILMIYFGPTFHPLMKTLGIVLAIICVVIIIAIGLALKNGKTNVNKILDKFEKTL